MINENKDWTENDVKTLKDLATKNTCTPCICKKLGRNENGVRSKASELKISLKPTDSKNCIGC